MNRTRSCTGLAALIALVAPSCNAPAPDTPGGSAAASAPARAAAPDLAAAVIGSWVATDGSGVFLQFGRDGTFQVNTQGLNFNDPGHYQFTDRRTVKVTGKNYVLTYNTRPIPMSFTVSVEEGDRVLVVAPTATRPMQMQFSLAGNYRLHVFPPEKNPTRYTRATSN
jgi:hypothetical protein